MSKIIKFVGAAGIGAALAYLFDPRLGKSRRSLVRDQVVHLLHQAGDTAESKARHLSNVTRGMVAEKWGTS